MRPLQKQQAGVSALEALLILVIVGILGFTSWYVLQAKHNTNQNLAPANSAAPKFKKRVAAQTTGPTANWVSYTSKAGRYSLKYPKTWVIATHLEECSPGLVLLGANAQSVGTCASENFGQMGVALQPDTTCEDLTSAAWTVSSKEAVTVSSVIGTKTTAMAKDTGDGLGSFPEGTKTVHYCFATRGRVYTADYFQLAKYPDVLADFNLMVTSTLRFE